MFAYKVRNHTLDEKNGKISFISSPLAAAGQSNKTRALGRSKRETSLCYERFLLFILVFRFRVSSKSNEDVFRIKGTSLQG